MLCIVVLIWSRSEGRQLIVKADLVGAGNIRDDLIK